jgi:hypothetical protein
MCHRHLMECLCKLYLIPAFYVSMEGVTQRWAEFRTSHSSKTKSDEALVCVSGIDSYLSIDLFR